MPPKLSRRIPAFDPKTLLKRVDGGKSVAVYGRKQVVFSQGDPADVVYYLQKGRVKLTVVSKQGKEAVVAFVGADMFSVKAAWPGSNSAYRQPPRRKRQQSLLTRP